MRVGLGNAGLYFATILICGSGMGVSSGQEHGLIAKWSFQQDHGPTVSDSAGSAEGKIGGFYSYVQGVSGSGLRFDGYTTSVTIPEEKAPSIGTKGFTVSAWIALNTYP